MNHKQAERFFKEFQSFWKSKLSRYGLRDARRLFDLTHERAIYPKIVEKEFSKYAIYYYDFCGKELAKVTKKFDKERKCYLNEWYYRIEIPKMSFEFDLDEPPFGLEEQKFFQRYFETRILAEEKCEEKLSELGYILWKED